MLATFAVILGYNVRQKLSLAMRLEQRDAARYISLANIRLAITQLKNQEKTDFFSLPDERSSRGLEPATQRDDENRTGFTKNDYGILVEESKINLNKADRHLLERLFKIILGYSDIEAQDLAASVVDWRDKDSMLSTPLGSAEDSYYTFLRYPYECKDADFDCLAELLLVKGVTQEVFEKIHGYVTVYGNGLVNVNTASREVLLALGLSNQAVNDIFIFRCGKDKTCGTEDDNYFTSPSEIVGVLGKQGSLNDAEIQRIEDVASRLLTVESNYFMIKSTVKFNQGKNIYRATCVADSSGKVLSWQEL